MNSIYGLLIIALAGILQGTFILPMTYARNWEWAHKWFSFSVMGMFLLNWLLAVLLIHNLPSIITSIPTGLLITVILFGLGWGAGAILFGKGMDLLGMALGYPVIMGINAAAGAIIPALIFSPDIFLQSRGMLILIGSALTIAGIIACAKASNMQSADTENTLSKRKLVSGLIIAVIAGFTSCLPNLGAAFSGKITSLALESGVSKVLAGNVVWSIFFTAGALVNAIYCIILTIKHKSTVLFISPGAGRNWIIIFTMSLMWIGSFYFYGIGSSMVSKSGLIVGWPLLISLSIIVGNLWGIYRGEWKNTGKKAVSMLVLGLILLIISVIIIAAGNNIN